MPTPYKPDQPQTQLDMPIGSNFCMCSGCGEFFSGCAGFDKHRAGDFGAGTRHCVNPTDVGMKIIEHPRGTLWINETVPDDHYQRMARQADHARAAQKAKRKEAA